MHPAPIILQIQIPANAKGGIPMSEYGKNNCTISCVECDVTNCIHNNHQNHCTAQSIKIGTQSACSCAETICQSFRAK